MKDDKCIKCGRMLTREEWEEFKGIKCSKCKNIRFDREIFTQIKDKIIENFKKTKKSELGSILKELHMLGSYARGEIKCGDIDITVTYNDQKKKKLIDDKLEEEFWGIMGFIEAMEEEREEVTVTDIKDFIHDSFWDFRTCEEYPECMSCCYESGWEYTEDTDYESPYTCCTEKCESKNRINRGVPACCFWYRCIFIDRNFHSEVLKRLENKLLDGIEPYQKLSGYTVKMVDILFAKSLEDLPRSLHWDKSKKPATFIKLC